MPPAGRHLLAGGGGARRLAAHRRVPGAAGLGAQAIWGGNDVDGFYASHLVASVKRFMAPGPYGTPTGKTFCSRAVADCMVFRNRIYREWLVRDNRAQLLNLGVDADGTAAITHQILRLLATIPDASWTPHHVCSVDPSNEGGGKVAVRWTLEGHHTGWGVLGVPTGKPLLALGMSQFHLKNGRIVEEHTLWDELALRVQIRLPPA